MKKLFSILLLINLLSVVSAQLKVDSEGDVCIGVESSDYKTHIVSSDRARALLVQNLDGGSGTSSFGASFVNYTSGFRDLYGLSSTVVPGSGSYNRSLAGFSYTGTPTSGRAYGVYGKAGNCTSGYNYAVYGYLYGSNNGAGVYGSSGNSGDPSIDGKYAGYFNGNVKVVGTLYADLVQESDRSLKKNIKKLDKQKDKLSRVVGYTYKYNEKLLISQEAKDAINDTASVKVDYSDHELLKKTHYGLIAQEVQEIYPDLVVEADNGTLAINYIGFIPILIEANNQLRAELDEIKAHLGLDDAEEKTSKTAKSTKSAKMVQGIDTTQSASNSADVSPVVPTLAKVSVPSSMQLNAQTATLQQNFPNPFTESTTISYYLPDNTSDAIIYIYDINGKQLKSYVLGDGGSRLELSSGEFYAGLFTYALVVDGVLIDSKQMVLTQ